MDSSAASSSARGTPWPSLPMKMAVGSRRSISCTGRPLCEEVTAKRMPFSSNAAIACAVATFTQGRRNTDPAEARATLGFAAETVPSVASTPLAPKASALRRMAGHRTQEYVVRQHNGFGAVRNLRKQPIGSLASRFGKEDRSQPQTATDSLFDQFDPFNGDRAILDGDGLGKGFAQLFYERVLAAGNGPESLVRRVGKSLGHVPPVNRGSGIVECWSSGGMDIITSRTQSSAR